MPKDREELQKLTVAMLRELAKKRLGPGTSKLRTKVQLIEALERGTIEAASPRARGKKAGVSRSPGARGGEQKSPPRRPASRRFAVRPGKAAIESAAAPDLQDDNAGVEAVLALPLDGRTLLVRWKPASALENGERLDLEVFSDGKPARTMDVAPLSRQAYVRPLVPGPVYRAQLVARTTNGHRRVIGSLSRPVVFCGEPAGRPDPAPERFVRYSWPEPARSAQGPDQPAPGSPLPGDSELAVLGAVAALRFGVAATSPGDLAFGRVAGRPLGWGPSSQLPTSFAK